MSLPICLVIGATGATGKHFVKHALAAGDMKLRLFVRTPSKLPEEVSGHANVEVVQGDLADVDAIAAAIVGVKYVISMAGDKNLSKDGIMEKFAKKVIEVAPGAGVEKFVYQAGLFSPMEGETQPLMMRIMSPIMMTMFGLNAMVADNNAVLNALSSSSGLRWTAPRPGMLKEAESNGTLSAPEDLPPPSVAVSFVDLAAFNLKMLTSSEYDSKAPFVAY